MALAGQQVVSWVWDTLKADAAGGGVNTLVSGRIYRDRVPQAAALPAVTVSLVSHVDQGTLGGRRVFAVTLTAPRGSLVRVWSPKDRSFGWPILIR